MATKLKRRWIYFIPVSLRSGVRSACSLEDKWCSQILILSTLKLQRWPPVWMGMTYDMLFAWNFTQNLHFKPPILELIHNWSLSQKKTTLRLNNCRAFSFTNNYKWTGILRELLVDLNQLLVIVTNCYRESSIPSAIRPGLHWDCLLLRVSFLLL